MSVSFADRSIVPPTPLLFAEKVPRLFVIWPGDHSSREVTVLELIFLLLTTTVGYFSLDVAYDHHFVSAVALALLSHWLFGLLCYMAGSHGEIR